MENKLYLNIGNGKKIVAEALDWHDDFPNELAVYIMDDNGVVIQDICLIREHYKVNTELETIANGDVIDCMVWADPEDEDYTHKFYIDAYKGEE